MVNTSTESELKRQQDDEHQRQEEEAEQQRLEQEAAHEIARNRELQARGRQVRRDILQTGLNEGVFATPQQNLVAAQTLMHTLKPLALENPQLGTTVNQVKAMVEAAAVQLQEQAATSSKAPPRSAGHTVNSRPQSSRARGGQYKGGDARDVINDRRWDRQANQHDNDRGD